ncbi:MAG: UDP-3-O-(3-hydroxymyristoyl)glucosamine N-acyltransferase, partial [Mesorhizobium sp.]
MTDPVFFAPSRRYTAGEVANLTGANLLDTSQAEIAIEALAPANEGGDGALVFVDGKRNFALMQSLKAAAVLCPADFANRAPQGIAVLVHPRPQQAFAMVGRLLFPQAATPGPMTGETGISPQAHIDPSAHVESGAIVEAGAVIGPGAAIGAGTVIAP